MFLMPKWHKCIKLLSNPIKNEIMKIIKVIEVIANSDKSFDEATKNAIRETSKSVQNIRSIYIKEMKAQVENNQIVSYGVIAKISFAVENEK